MKEGEDDILDQKRRIQALATATGGTGDEESGADSAAEETKGGATTKEKKGDDDNCIQDQKQRIQALNQQRPPSNSTTTKEGGVGTTLMTGDFVGGGGEDGVAVDDDIRDQKQRVQSLHTGASTKGSGSAPSNPRPSSTAPASVPGAHPVYTGRNGTPSSLSGGGRRHEDESVHDDGGATANSNTNTSSNVSSNIIYQESPLDAQVVTDQGNMINGLDIEARIQQRIRERTVEAVQVLNARPEEPKPVDSSAAATKAGRGQGDSSDRNSLLVCLFVFGMVCSIAIVVALLLKSDDGTADTMLDEDAPAREPATANGTMSMEEHLVNLLTTPIGEESVTVISDVEELVADIDNDRYRALQWLVHEDPYPTTTMAISEKESINQNIINTMLVERFVIVLLYYAMGGSNWVNGQSTELLHFLTNSSVCEWNSSPQGVKCDDRGLVNSINFNAVNITGTIPSEVGVLTNLQTLITSENSPGLVGTLPTEIGLLSQLTVLKSFACEITGTIPETLTKLRKLEHFDLGDAQFSGTIPSGLFALTRLETFYAQWNHRLNGTLPEVSPDVEHLREIRIDGNAFSGGIPASYYEQSDLELLNLAWNYGMSGTLSTEIGQLTQLKRFLLSWSGFDGTIPTEIGLLTNVGGFILWGNPFDGTLPTEIGSMERLEEFDVDNNLLTGTIPSEIGNLQRLSALYMPNNELTGMVPIEIGQINGLEVLDLTNTNLTQDALEGICSMSALFAEIEADCLAGDIANATNSSDPEVNCPCCTTCCHDLVEDCQVNDAAICQLWVSKFTLDGGPWYDPTRGTKCECLDDGLTMSCQDESCLSCTRDLSVCARNADYGMTFSETHKGWWNGWNHTFQYVSDGLNDTTVRFEALGFQCKVFVNDGQCRSCLRRWCDDGFWGFEVLCDNVEGAGNMDLCDGDATDDGPLTVFALQDPLLLDGCVPNLEVPLGFDCC